jgi:ferrous iron transport protein B
MPIFAPMGLHTSNWPAVMSLMTGMLAKEVVIGTLDNLYAQMSHVGSNWQALMPVDIGQICHQAVVSILQHLQTLVGWPGSETDVTMSATLSEQLRQYFRSPIAAYAYLLFVLLYIPCVSTMAAIRQEANRRLMWFSIMWSIVLAYGSAVLFYQVAMWVVGIPTNRIIFSLAEGLGLIICVWMGWQLVKLGGRHAPGSA